MTNYVSRARSPHHMRLLSHRSTLPAPDSPQGTRQPLRSMSLGRSCAASSTYTEPDPIPRAGLDDYLGGRCDRIGRDLLLDLRPPAESARRPLTCVLPLAVPCTVRDVAFHVRRLSPDLVWLYADDLKRAQVVARHIVDSGVETIIIHEPDDDW